MFFQNFFALFDIFFQLFFVRFGKFIATFANELFQRQYHLVKSVARFYKFATFFIFFGVLFCIFDSFVDICIGKVCGRRDCYGLFLLSAKVLCGNVNDTVSVDIKFNFDLRDSTWSGSNTRQGETTKCFVVACHFTFALQNVDVYAGLVICSGREHLRFACRNGCVTVDKFCHNATQNFDTQGKWGYIQQQNVFNFATKNTALDCCTDSNALVGVNSLVWFLTAKLLDSFHNGRDTCGTTNQDNAVEVAVGYAGITHCVLHRNDRALDDTVNQTFKLCTSKFYFQVFGTGCICRDKRKRNGCFESGRKFDFCLFGSFLQTLYRLFVVGQVDTACLFEFCNKVVDNDLVDIVTTKVSITVGCKHFEHAVANFQNGNVERTTTKVVNQNLLVFVFALIKTVSKCCSSRFVDNTKHFQAGNFACVLCCLTLSVTKICRNGYYRLRNFFAKICFCISL